MVAGERWRWQTERFREEQENVNVKMSPLKHGTHAILKLNCERNNVFIDSFDHLSNAKCKK